MKMCIKILLNCLLCFAFLFHSNVLWASELNDEERIKEKYAQYYNEEYNTSYSADEIWYYDDLGTYQDYQIMIIFPFNIESNYQDGTFKIGNETLYYSDNIYCHYLYAYNDKQFIRVEDAYEHKIFDDQDITDIAYITGLKAPSFRDVRNNSIFFKVIEEANRYGWMQDGGKKGWFYPKQNVSRAMITTILYRIDGICEVEYEKVFNDVKQGLWYSDAIVWAKQSNVIHGYQNGLFGVDDEVTRQDLAVMLYNYYCLNNKNKTEVSNHLNDYLDGLKVSQYAKKALNWCIENEIITGSIVNDQTYLNPSEYATREQCAKMIVQFMKCMN